MSNPAVVSGGAQGDYRAGTSTLSLTADAHHEAEPPRCLLCPICACGYPCCRVDVEAVAP